METPLVITKLVNSYATLVMAHDAGMSGGRPIEEVPENYTYRNETYPMRQMVEIEIANRIVNALT